MKKILIFILFLSYFATSTGATINVHYCMGKLADWSLMQTSSKKKCSKCGMKKEQSKKNSCCSDENKWVKIQDDQKANSCHYKIKSACSELFEITPATPQEHPTALSLPKGYPLVNAPPAVSPSIYLINCTFLI